MKKPFGEIIESTLSSFKSQCWQWDVVPPFGSLVVLKSHELTLFGIVSAVETGSFDKGRFPFPYQKTEEELKREQPQIFALLQSHVSCVTVGYLEDSSPYYQLPPFPPKIHAFVRVANEDEMRFFFNDAAYLHVLCGASDIQASLPELLLALIKQLLDQQIINHLQLQSFIATYSSLMSNDYRKFKLFLQRIESLVDVISHKNGEKRMVLPQQDL